MTDEKPGLSISITAIGYEGNKTTITHLVPDGLPPESVFKAVLHTVMASIKTETDYYFASSQEIIEELQRQEKK